MPTYLVYLVSYAYVPIVSYAYLHSLLFLPSLLCLYLVHILCLPSLFPYTPMPTPTLPLTTACLFTAYVDNSLQ